VKTRTELKWIRRDESGLSGMIYMEFQIFAYDGEHLGLAGGPAGARPDPRTKSRCLMDDATRSRKKIPARDKAPGPVSCAARRAKRVENYSAFFIEEKQVVARGNTCHRCWSLGSAPANREPATTRRVTKCTNT
jgi:hypothetical protein